MGEASSAVRPYLAEDAPRVAAFFAAVHERDARVQPIDEVSWRGFVARSANRDGADFRVVEEDGALVALLTSAVLEDPRVGGLVRHFRIVVAPAHRQQGVARRLMQEVEAQAARDGAVMLQAMTTRAWAAGAMFLERAGFSVVMRDLLMTRPNEPPARGRAAPAGVSVRAYAGDRDHAAWAALCNAGYAREAVGFTETEESVASSVRMPGFALWIAERDAHPIGFCHVSGVRERVGAIQGLVVDRAHEGHGIGAALLARGLTTLERGPYDRVELVVESSNERAISLYRGFGFEAADELCTWRRPCG